MFDINIESYKEYFGGKASTHELFEEFFTTELEKCLTHFQGELIYMYNFLGETHNHKIGIPNNKLHIFHNATSGEVQSSGRLYEDAIINGKPLIPVGTSMLHLNGTGEIIYSDNDIPIAEYFAQFNTLNILFKNDDDFNDATREVWIYIFKKLNTIFEEQGNYYSWAKTKDKEGLVKEIKQNIESTSKRLLEDVKSKVRVYEDKIASYKRELKSALDNLVLYMKQATELTDDSDVLANKIIRDLDLIVSHEKVKDVIIEGRMFKVFTHPLIITDDRDRRFIGGEYTIIIDLANANVTFDGNNRKRGWWTNEDIHPHVSGRDGTACFGNVLSTIAELSSQNELYALTLLMIDFLQSANTSDPAGHNVVNWDMIDEDGNIIEVEDAPDYDWTCEACEEGFYDYHDSHVVYDEVDEDGTVYGEHYVCDTCLENHYYWNEDAEEYIRD